MVNPADPFFKTVLYPDAPSIEVVDRTGAWFLRITAPRPKACFARAYELIDAVHAERKANI